MDQLPSGNFRIHEDHVSVYDVMKYLGLKSNLGDRLNRYRSSVEDDGVIECSPTERVVDGVTDQCSGSAIPMMNWPHVQKLVCYLLRNGQRSQEEIQTICEVWGLPESQLTSAYVSMPEKDTLLQVMRAMPYRAYPQFRIGPYRIDLYFPDIRLAVSCAENKHSGYNVYDERERIQFICEQLQCRFVEYDPLQPRFHVLDVIRDIIRRLNFQERLLG
jgi:very-short-patch-repair endonuclease